MKKETWGNIGQMIAIAVPRLRGGQAPSAIRLFDVDAPAEPARPDPGTSPGWRYTGGVIFSLLLLTACERTDPPARVMNFGTSLDSASGAVMVMEGDTLWNIAQRYDIPMRDLIDINDLDAPYEMTAGQRLKLPAPRHYNVQERDTLYSISRVFGVDVTELVRANHMAPPYSITVGQKLRIPASYRRSFMSRFQEREDLSPPAVREELLPAVRTEGSGSGRLQWPVGGEVISDFGPKPGGLHNDGINIAAPRGSPVLAADDGTVIYVGDELSSYGNLVLVRHSGDLVTAYAHLGSVQVSRGKQVIRGQTIGTVGSSGTVGSPQVHFEVRRGSSALDPEKYLSARG